MSTVAHALSASLIAVTAAGIAPGETRYLWIAIVAAAIADADHIWPVLRDWKFYRENGFRGNLHGARSPLHELFGLATAGAAGTMLWFADPRLAFIVFAAYAIHLAQDFVLGRSVPFAPFERTPVQMFAASFRVKAAADVLTILISGGLWLAYLNGRV